MSNKVHNNWVILPDSDNGDTISKYQRLSPEHLALRTLISVIEDYLTYYGSGKTHTAKAKRYDLNKFMQFMTKQYGGANSIRVSDWTTQKTKDFVDACLQGGEAPATVCRRLATLKHFGRTLAERIPGYINPAREVKSPTLQISNPQGLSSHEIVLLKRAALIQVQNKNTYPSHRNRFLLELMLGTGLRADEVRLLTYGQISKDHSWLKHVRTKGRKFRNVYLNSTIQSELESYLESRLSAFAKHKIDHNTLEVARLPLFLSFRNSHVADPYSFTLAPKTIWRIIANLGTQAQALSDKEIGGLHPHRLRHTFAHGLLESSGDIRLVAQALGHSDVRTTMRYTERSDEDIAAAIENKHHNLDPQV